MRKLKAFNRLEVLRKGEGIKRKAKKKLKTKR